MNEVAWLGRRPLPVADRQSSSPASTTPDGTVLAAVLGVLDGTTRAEVALMDGPHILVCTDSVTGTTTYTGPFLTGYDALANLEDHESGQQPRPGVRTVVCRLAPLLPG